MSARVVQLLSGAGRYDAVTNQALAWARRLRGWGRGGDVFAGDREPRLDGSVRPAAELAGALGRDDLLLVHYSAHHQALDAVAALPQRKLLVYHNITPPEFLWDFEPLVAVRCAIGRDRLAGLAGAVDGAVAATEFNAADLRAAGFADVRVAPALYDLDLARLAPRGALPAGLDPADGPIVTFVGRFSPNKRQDVLIKAFALYQRHRRPDARLALAGGPPQSPYRSHLERTARAAGANGVEVVGPLPQATLNSLYAASSVFVCLSEHEGFCIPVLEAFAFGLPVIARRAGGVPEVAGDAAILLDDADLATVAELIDLCVTEDGLRNGLAARGRARLADFTSEASEAALRSLCDGAVRTAAPR